MTLDEKARLGKKAKRKDGLTAMLAARTAREAKDARTPAPTALGAFLKTL